MATYSTDLTTINDAASGTWVELTGTILGFTLSGAGGPGAETENFIQGIECRSQTTGKATDAEISITFDNGSGYSFSADEVVYAWLYYAVGVNLKTYANSGWMFVICDSLTTGDYFVIGGSDYGRNPYGGWTNVAIDPTATQSGTLGGGGNSGTYRYFGQVCNTIGEITKGNPSAVDAIRVGRGTISITGTGGSFSELAQYNDYNAGGTPPGTSSTSVDTGRHRLGIFQEQAGTYLFKGLLSLGTSGSSVTFTDSNETIIIDDCPHTYASFNKIEINNASSSVTWTNITFNSTATTANGLGYFEMVANATVSFTGCTFNNFGTTVLLSNGTLTACNFNSTKEITVGGATLTNTKVLTPTVAADSYGVLWNTTGDPDGELDGMEFSKGANAHHAIQFDATNSPTTITLRNISFSGFNAVDGNNDSTLNFPSTSKSYTVNLIGCTGNISYKVGVGGSVTLVSDPAALTLSGLVANTEVTIVKRGTAVDTGADGATTVSSRNFVTGNAWTVDAYKGFLLEITSGADIGRYYVYGNTATTLYLDTELTATASSLTWELYDENDDTVAYHVENSSGNVVYSYTTGAGDKVDIITLHVDYQDIVVESYTLLSSNATIPLTQAKDVNYFNPI